MARDAVSTDSIGFNETSWLDFGGHPHSEALRTTERLTRKTFGRLDIEVGLDDPKVCSRARSPCPCTRRSSPTPRCSSTSATRISMLGTRLDFVKEGETATHLIFHIVEGDMKAMKADELSR